MDTPHRLLQADAMPAVRAAACRAIGAQTLNPKSYTLNLHRCPNPKP